MTTLRYRWSVSSMRSRANSRDRFSGTEVVVKHFGNGVLLLPLDDPWQTLEAGFAAFEPGFVLERQQPDDQIRAETRP